MWLTVWRSEMLMQPGMCSRESGYRLPCFEDVNYGFMMLFSLWARSKNIVGTQCLPWNMAAFPMIRRLSWALTTCRPDSMLLRAATWYRSSIFLEQQVGPLVWQTCRSAPGRKPAETGQKSRWAKGRSCKSHSCLTLTEQKPLPSRTEKRFSCIICMLNIGNTTADSAALMSRGSLCGGCIINSAKVKNKYIQEMHQGCVDPFGQQKKHSRPHISHRGSNKSILSRCIDESQQPFRGRQTNPGFSVLSLCMIFWKKKKKKIEGDETTFLHQATDTTSCLHRWEIIGFPELFWKVRM